MGKLKIRSSNLKRKSALIRAYFCFLLVLVFGCLGFITPFFQGASAQSTVVVQTLPPTNYRIGERLTYNFSLEKFNNVAYAETFVVSRGKLAEKDAVELRSKFNTVDMVGAFFPVDETRTTFASPQTGLPLYVRKITASGGFPTEQVSNFLVSPTINFDLLTLIYQVRQAGGAGNFPLQENDKIYNVNFLQNGVERIKTDIGEFETNVTTVQSDYFTERGITDFRMNFGTDTYKIPILIRFKTARGEFRGSIASIQMLEPEVEAIALPTPTPRPTVIPTPRPTATPYIENQALLPELPFKLGETLTYQVSQNGQTIAVLAFQAKERKLFRGEDSLLLTATVNAIEPRNQIFNLTDTIRAHVNPDSLAPQHIELRFSGFFSGFNQITQFDQKTGTAVFNGTNRVDVPVGTHSVLSLAYAIRSFNLKPSKDPSSPVNDTRVAVFVGNKHEVFILRPSDAEVINLKGERVSAQLISITTGNPLIDQYNLKVWLSNDESRVPLRLTFGNYQADLVAVTQVPPINTP